MSVAIKICGLNSEDAVRAAAAARADFAGFIYFPASPRHIGFARAAKLKKLLPPAIKSVSVLVSPDDALLAEAQAVLQPDYIQLHGNETPARIAEIRKKFPEIKIIKAVSVRSGDDVAQAMPFTDCADLLMFDAKPPQSGGLPGGNGLAFDWALLAGREFSLKWFLSGGLNAENVAQALRQTGARMVDVSSGVESAPGVKDPALIQEFADAVRRYET